MRKYNFYHFYVFNVKGCPGMRYGNLKLNFSKSGKKFFME
jgi:hypothetical protein